MPYTAMIERIRGEFLEMPGLRLTAAQVRRLCGVDPTTCQVVLDALVDINFLQVRADGTYARPSDVSSASHLRGSMRTGDVIPKVS